MSLESELLDRARKLVPVLAERNPEAERRGSLHSETIQELLELGVTRLFMPRKYGGLELDWGIHVELGKVIAAGCGSSAWITSVVAPQTYLMARFAPEVQDEVWGDGAEPLVVHATFTNHGTLRWTGEGFILNGHWHYTSGIDHADWALVSAVLPDADGRPGDPLICLIPRSDFTIGGEWVVTGLQATGSRDLIVKDVYVPSNRAVPTSELLGADPPGGAIGDHYLFRGDVTSFFGSSIIGPVLGLARSGYEAYRKATAARVGTVFGDRVAESSVVQERLAHSSAAISAAELVGDRIVRLQHQAGTEMRPLAPSEHAGVLRDRAWLTWTCIDALYRLVRSMGTAGLQADNTASAALRDLQAAANQISVNWDRNMVAYGRFSLGLRTGVGPLDGTAGLPIA